MSKFTLNLTASQERLLDSLQESLNAVTRADVLRKALELAALYAEIKSRGDSLAVVDAAGVIRERVRVL